MKRILIGGLLMALCLTLRGQSNVLADAVAWQPIASLSGVSVTALALSPNYDVDHTVFAGLRGQGVYRTMDSGDTWQSSGLPDQVIIDLAISPAYATDHTIFAAVGLPNTGFNVYHSNDGSTTWQSPYVTPDPNNFQSITQLSISPNFANDHMLYVIGTSATYKSDDGGLTFFKSSGWFGTHHVTHLIFSPAYTTDHMLFAAVQNDQLYKSTNGSLWNPAGLGGDVSALAISPDYATDHMLAAITAGDGQLHLSTNQGASWTSGTLTLGVGGQHLLLFSPTFASDNLMLAASSTDPGAYRSTDGGASWTQVGWYNPYQAYQGGFMGGSIQALAVSGNTTREPYAFAGTRSGLYRSLNRGQNWYPHSTGLPHLTVRSLAIAPNDPTRLLAGTSYFNHQRFDGGSPGELDGALQLSTDGGQTWQDVDGPLDRVERVAFSPDLANDHIALACTGVAGPQGFVSGGIYRSTDSGQHWSAALTAMACRTLALSPNFAVDHTAWASAFSGPLGLGLLRSADSGATWTLLTSAVSTDLIVLSSNYATDHTLFAATQDGRLQKSTDGGQHWTPTLNHLITALALSPAYGASQTIYAGVKDSSSVPGAMYRSMDGGATWQTLSTGIPANAAGGSLNIAALNFAADGSVLIGVTYGDGTSGAAVYRSIDGGQTWPLLGSGLSAYALFDLASTANDNNSDLHGALTFYAGTSDGLWRIDQSQRDPTELGVWDTGGPRGGRADVLAVSPNFANDGVALTAEWNRLSHTIIEQYGSGILKSTDWGQTWQSGKMGSVPPPFYSSAVHGYSFSPDFAIDETVFAATWGGLFKSMDGGENWQWLNPGVRNRQVTFIAVAVAPNYTTSGQVMAATGCIFRSMDFGATWSEDCSVGGNTIAYSPNFAADQTLFIGGYKNGYKSIDGGTSWTPVLTLSVTALAVSPQFSHDQTLYAGGPDGLVKSTDGGATWISATIGISNTAVNALAISPAFAADQTLFAATNVGLYRSNDGGATWSQITALGSSPISSLAISPEWPAHSYLLAGTAQGVYRTTDGGMTWARMPGLSPFGAGMVALSPDEGLWLTSSHGLQASTDHGRTWSPFGLQNWNTGKIAISPAYATDHTIFATVTCIGCSMGGGIERTTDNGTTWQSVFSEDGLGSLAISPQYAADHTLYAISYGSSVVRSTDGGDHWSGVGTWPPYPATQRVALPPDYPTDATVFAAGPGVWRLPPGETIWQPAASGILTTTDMTALVVAPNYTTSHTLLAVTAELLSDYTRHYGVFRSDDGGVNWQPSGLGVPDVELRGLAFSPNYAADHTAYLVSTSQLYRSIDDGHSWTALGAPPDWAWLNGVSVTRAGQVIVSSDSGVWRYSAGFRDILIEGDFEVGSGWQLISNAVDDAENVVFSGRRALRLGLDHDSNAAIDSAAIQTVTIPMSVTLAQLHLRIYPVSGEPIPTSQKHATTIGDAQYLAVTLSNTAVLSHTLLWTLSNAQAWQRYSFDLTPYAGQTLVLRLGVVNDGLGGQTAMYVDNASLITLGPSGRKVYLPVILKNYAN